MRQRFAWIVLLIFLMVPSLAWASPTVRVGLINGKDTVVISSQRPYQIINVADGNTIAAGRGGEKWTVSFRDGQMYLNSDRLYGAIAFVLEPGDENEMLTVNGRRYRGELEIRLNASKRGLTVIETLPMEEYIYGIITREISPAWPMESVKAQAVAARTYALYHMGKHSKDGFDVCTTEECQVYGGREAEDPRGNWAVDATRGMVVTYKNKIIPTFFYSSSGGYTENVENVWGGYYPYLRAVPDFDQGNPKYQWKTTYTTQQMEQILQKAGYKLGTLRGVELSPLRIGQNDAPDRGVSGRVKLITFVGSDQKVQLTGDKVRSLFGLDSTLFDIKLNETPVSVSTAADKKEAVKIEESKKKKRKKMPEPVAAETVKQPLPVSGNGVNTASSKPERVEPVLRLFPEVSATTPIIIEGRGWGHGVGLSQWGAKAMADKGPKDDNTYYQQILKHYYQGVDITKLY